MKHEGGNVDFFSVDWKTIVIQFISRNKFNYSNSLKQRDFQRKIRKKRRGTSFHCTSSVSVKKQQGASFHNHFSCKILPPLISWKYCKKALSLLNILCLMKEQHFQKLEVFHAFCLLIFSHTCKNEQTKSKGIWNPSFGHYLSFCAASLSIKGFFLCKQASKSGRKLQFISCLVIIQAIDLSSCQN